MELLLTLTMKWNINFSVLIPIILVKLLKTLILSFNTILNNSPSRGTCLDPLHYFRTGTTPDSHNFNALISPYNVQMYN